MICAMYLRKSRADFEAEACGEGETLAKHRETLERVAAARGLTVTDIYAEVVSGDTIAERPEMQRLLRAVERGDYDAVLCMDIDRLGRGDGADQAAILKTLKYSDTVVITPYKDYNTRREMDEEFFEYSQFIARSEYKRIKRRMWAGRVASVKEGKWLSPKAPFGYRRVRLENAKGWTLTPDPAEAEAVKSIFAWYASGECGRNTIANRLNGMGFRTLSGKKFMPCTVWSILKNPVYIGKVRWSYRRQHVEMQSGKEVVTRPRSDECIIVDGLHPAIVDEKTFADVQSIMSSHLVPSNTGKHKLVNPLSGLIFCAHCGHAMILSPEYQRKGVDSIYRCSGHSDCPTSRIASKCVYDALLFTLREWSAYGEAEQYAENNTFKPSSAVPMIRAVTAQIAQLRAQLSRMQDLLETGVYSAETYIERSKLLNARIASATEELSNLKATQKEDDRDAIIRHKPQIDHLLAVWDTASPAERNALLKKIVRRIEYQKTKRCLRCDNPADYLTLIVSPVTE